MRLNPLTRKKLRRFREIRRGYFSFLVLMVLVALSLVGELLISDRAIVVRHAGDWSFPTYSRVRLGSEFGLKGSEGQTPVDYRAAPPRMGEHTDALLGELLEMGDEEIAGLRKSAVI